jgi:hypothetical protein
MRDPPKHAEYQANPGKQSPVESRRAGSANNCPQAQDMSPRATPAAPSAPHKSRASTALVIIKGALDAAVPIISIAQHLNALDYKVRIVCSDCSEPLRDELSAAGLTVTRLQAPGLLPSIANSALQKPANSALQ